MTTVAAPGSAAERGGQAVTRPAGERAPRLDRRAVGLRGSALAHPDDFSGVDDGRSVVFSILGRRWRVTYNEYRGTCLLLFVCDGPSA